MRGGTVALGVACTGTAVCVAYVHWEQRRDIRRMQQSVLYDAEREAIRRRVVALREQQAAADAGKAGAPVGRDGAAR
jgi:hypothetical protein